MKLKRIVMLAAALLFVFCVAALAEEQAPKPSAPMTSTAGPGGQDFPVGKLATLVNFQ